MEKNKVREQFDLDRYKGIADKIVQLLDKTYDSQLSNKRWVWELMQNAKDVPNKFGRVSIRIELWPDKLVFSHNGDFFTIGNISGLIQQVSSKDSANEGDVKQTGKFGTGFITTHLLSKIIDVDGIVQNPNTEEYQRFTLRLDRSARKSEDMIPSIKKSLEKFEDLDKDSYVIFPLVNDYENREETSLDTSFTYYLDEDALRAAQIGLNDLINTLPITMVSLHEIKSVVVFNHVVNEKQEYQCNNYTLQKTGNVEIIKSVISINESKKYYLTYKTYEQEKPVVALSIETKIDDDGKFVLVRRDKEQPVLFRDFPLIGSEDFYFPYMLNGFDFDPTETRNGILLNNNELKPQKNRRLIEKAVNAVIEFNEWLLSQGASNTYLLASSQKPKPKEPWDETYAKPWIENLQKEWREKLLSQSVVETTTGCSTLAEIRIPDYGTKEANRKFYSFLEDFIQEGVLPLSEQQDEWSNVINAEYPTWNANLKYTKQDFFEDLQRVGCVGNLCFRLGRSETECYTWLNDLYQFVEEQGDEEYLEKYPVIPNQSGDFCLLGDLHSDASQRIPDRLKDISAGLLNRNLRDELISENVSDQVFKKKREYTLASLIADINKKIHNEIEKEDFVSEDDWAVVSNGVYRLLALKTNNEDWKQAMRDRIYAFAHHYVQGIPAQELIADIPDALWTETDAFILKSVPQLVARNASTLEELRTKMLIYPQTHIDEECIAWINEYGQICKCYNFNVTQDKEIYPNQNGVLLSLSELHYDNAIPEEFKSLTFTATDEDWHSKLLDRRITGYENLNKLSTKDIYDSIKKSFEVANDDKKLRIAKEAICLIPVSQQMETSENMTIYGLAKSMAKTIGEKHIINNTEGSYWEIFTSYMLRYICKSIAESVSIGSLATAMGTDEVTAMAYTDDVIEFAETRYGKRYSNLVESEYGVWLNQNGYFCPFKEIYKDGDVLDILKEIAKNEIVGIDYRAQLLRTDMRCKNYISADASIINNKTILVKIDDVVGQYIQDKRSFQDHRFADLVFRLNKLINDNSAFKNDLKVFWSNHDKLIVGTIQDEKTLAIVGALASDPDKLKLIDDISRFNKEEINHLLDKLKSKKPSEEVEITTSNGIAKISLSDTLYAGLSKEQMGDALNDAKEAVRERMEIEGYEFTLGLCEGCYGNINGVMKDGKEYPLVVHSYKSNSRPFQLTAFDWEQLARPNSMLWLNTYDGVKCIPFYALAKDRGTINISFAAENFDIADRSTALAQVLRYFKGLHFDFGTMIPNCGNEIVLFNKPEKPILEALGAKSDGLLC